VSALAQAPAQPATAQQPGSSPDVGPANSPELMGLETDAAAPTPSASASTADSAQPDAGVAAAASSGGPAPSYAPPAYQAPAYPAGQSGASTFPALPPPPAPRPEGPDSGRAHSVISRLEARAVAEVGGVWSQGLDATDASTRAGGAFAAGTYSINEQLRLLGRYLFATGTIVERLPGSRIDAFGAPNEVRVTQSRHVMNAALGYLVKSKDGRERFWALPFLGPRLLVLGDDVAPRTAFEVALGARAGIWSGDTLEASAWIAWAPALAKTSNPGDVYGAVLAELDFGAGAAIALSGPFGLTLGYEGNVVTLAHQKLSHHQVLTGLSYAFQ
jgi:hypothetical protein